MLSKLPKALILFAFFTACSSEAKTFDRSEYNPDIALKQIRSVDSGLAKLLEEYIPEYLSRVENPTLTVIDYSRPSTEKRLWTVNMKSGELLFHSLVAHGKGTGANEATDFSNEPGSKKSSLGFFLTGKSYYGKHGYSLRLKGLEEGLNDNAYRRSIVIHSADYVSQAFIKKHGRLGRSWGCPALPHRISDSFIDKTKNGSLLFIYGEEADSP